MKQEIDQFIWPFQQHFRRSVEYETERALEGIGFHTKPRALLVGFAQDEAVRHQVCGLFAYEGGVRGAAIRG